MRISVITGGSRGDVQPLLALASGQRAAGHGVRFCTHPLFAEWVGERGLEFFSLSGNDPRQVVAHEQHLGRGGRSYLRVLRRLFRRGTPDAATLARLREACAGTDAVVCSPVAGAARHAAEALGVPCFIANLFPTAATRAFPSPLAPAALRLGGAYNWLTHAAAHQLFWLAGREWVNRWRTRELNLPPLPALGDPRARRGGATHLFGFSPSVVPRPTDWGGALHITGYWFLDRETWQPDERLARFLADGEPPVCVGFGSMIDARGGELSEVVMAALKLTGRRAVLVRGWGGAARTEGDVLVIESAPYAWLYPRVRVAVHHGGTGTVAEALRVGVSQVTMPFFGEQRFWGRRLRELGVAPAPIPRERLCARRLANAIDRAATEPRTRARAAALGERVRGEDGVARAVELIERACGVERRSAAPSE